MTRARRSRTSGVAAAGLGAGPVYLWVLAGMLIALAVVPLPDQGIWVRFRAFLAEATGIILVCWVLIAGDWSAERARAAMRATVNLAILAYLAWIVLSIATSSFPQHSLYEGMRHVGGALLFFAVVYGLPGRQSHQLAVALAIVASAGAFEAFVTSGSQRTGRISGAFIDEQLLAAFLCVLFPLAVSTVRAEEATTRRLVALVASVMCAVGLMATRNRSTWAGALVSIVVLIALFARFGRSRHHTIRIEWQDVLVFLVAVAASVAIFFAFTNYGQSVAHRFSSLSRLGSDTSVTWRLDAWKAGLQMALREPVMGTGIGTFGFSQQLYLLGVYNQGVVFEQGRTLWESPHNSFIQLAAETGFVGLGLYLLVLAAFFGTALKSLRVHRHGGRRFLVMGSIAAIAGQMVSAMGSPAWEYAECSVFLWVVMGLGMSASGLGERGTEAELAEVHRSRRRHACDESELTAEMAAE